MRENNSSHTQHNERINLCEDREVQEWALRFNITRTQLIFAIIDVGNRASDVQAHLLTRQGQ